MKHQNYHSFKITSFEQGTKS